MAKFKLYETPSGLGGTFTVRVLKDFGNGLAKVKVHMPRNPDFHGYEFVARDLTPVESNRRKTGGV